MKRLVIAMVAIGAMGLATVLATHPAAAEVCKEQCIRWCKDANGQTFCCESKTVCSGNPKAVSDDVASAAALPREGRMCMESDAATDAIPEEIGIFCNQWCRDKKTGRTYCCGGCLSCEKVCLRWCGSPGKKNMTCCVYGYTCTKVPC